VTTPSVSFFYFFFETRGYQVSGDLIERFLGRSERATKELLVNFSRIDWSRIQPVLKDAGTDDLSAVGTFLGKYMNDTIQRAEPLLP
jgi:hypothetical protein